MPGEYPHPTPQEIHGQDEDERGPVEIRIYTDQGKRLLTELKSKVRWRENRAVESMRARGEKSYEEERVERDLAKLKDAYTQATLLMQQYQSWDQMPRDAQNQLHNISRVLASELYTSKRPYNPDDLEDYDQNARKYLAGDRTIYFPPFEIHNLETNIRDLSHLRGFLRRELKVEDIDRVNALEEQYNENASDIIFGRKTYEELGLGEYRELKERGEIDMYKYTLYGIDDEMKRDIIDLDPVDRKALDEYLTSHIVAQGAGLEQARDLLKKQLLPPAGEKRERRLASFETNAHAYNERREELRSFFEKRLVPYLPKDELPFLFTHRDVKSDGPKNREVPPTVAPEDELPPKMKGVAREIQDLVREYQVAEITIVEDEKDYDAAVEAAKKVLEPIYRESMERVQQTVKNWVSTRTPEKIANLRQIDPKIVDGPENLTTPRLADLYEPLKPYRNLVSDARRKVDLWSSLREAMENLKRLIAEEEKIHLHNIAETWNRLESLYDSRELRTAKNKALIQSVGQRLLEIDTQNQGFGKVFVRMIPDSTMRAAYRRMIDARKRWIQHEQTLNEVTEKIEARRREAAA